jgi:predicted phosphate transport protein (TIGR00153 family)
VRFRLVPVDERFFELFTESALNAAECARRLRDFLADPRDPEAGHAAVVECERKGDDITRDLLHRLNSTFVTPFDREDIHALAEELDDVVDDIMEVAHRLRMGPVDNAPPELKEQADLLVRMAEEAVELCARLEGMKGVGPHLEAIDRLESEGDSVYRRTLARLFSGEYEALDVVRWKDTVEAMEAALNTIEDISDVIESIVLKHA